MLSKLEKIIFSSSIKDVKRAFVLRVKHERATITSGPDVFEEVSVSEDAALMPDGREVFVARGKRWALKPEIHTRLLADAMEQARPTDATEQKSQPAQPAPHPAVCTSLIDGQLCGGTLINATVCPRCALGKSGVAATRTCDVCGHVTAVMRGDS